MTSPTWVGVPSSYTMADWFEILVVAFRRSGKAQLALGIALVLTPSIVLIGRVLSSKVVFDGHFAPMAEPIRQMIVDRYLAVAIYVFVSSLGLMVVAIVKERKKILEF